MTKFAALICALYLAPLCAAQDVALRERAVTMLERANAVSTPQLFGSYEQTINLRSYSLDKGEQEGQFNSVTLGPRSYRDEYDFAGFHLLVVVNGEMIADVGDRAKAPFEIRKLTLLNPIRHVRFDKSDVIRKIQDGAINGRSADCIEFDTIQGEKSDANEICIDHQLGTLARLKLGDETTTNSEFFRYRGAYVPGHITFEKASLHMELAQTMVETTGPQDPNVLVPPAAAQVGHVCKAYRRPFGEFIPQPKSGTGDQVVDIIVHGTIRKDGHIRDASIDASQREDLNAEALRVFESWKFTPAIRDARPIEIPADVTLHPTRLMALLCQPQFLQRLLSLGCDSCAVLGQPCKARLPLIKLRTSNYGRPKRHR